MFRPVIHFGRTPLSYIGIYLRQRPMALSKGPFIYYVGTFRSRRIPVSIARTVKWANLNIVRNEKKKIFQKHIQG